MNKIYHDVEMEIILLSKGDIITESVEDVEDDPFEINNL